MFVWGGYRPNIPLVHYSPDKVHLTSSVGVYSIRNGSFVNRPTTGYPPHGMIFYSCCNIGNDIYYFGGSCKDDDCHHNDLFVLNTTSDKWRQIVSNRNDGPIKKSACGIIPFNINGEDYLLLIGGCGPVPAANSTPDHSQYIPHPDYPSMCFTNEVHIMCTSSTPIPGILLLM